MLATLQCERLLLRTYYITFTRLLLFLCFCSSSGQEIDTKLTHQAQCARKFYVGVAEILNRQCDKLVFLLFDIKSHGMFKVLLRIISSGNHTVVKGPPLISLQQPHNPMKCFTEVNHNLTAAGKTPIDWLAL